MNTLGLNILFFDLVCIRWDLEHGVGIGVETFKEEFSAGTSLVQAGSTIEAGLIISSDWSETTEVDEVKEKDEVGKSGMIAEDETLYDCDTKEPDLLKM